MVPEAVIFGLRIVILILLWGFVLAAVVAVRHDIFGGRRMTSAAPRTAAPPAPVATPAPAPALASRSARRAEKAKDQLVVRRLLVTDGPLAGTMLPLAGASITIGRSPDSTLVLNDDYASNHHARLSPSPNGVSWIVEDLGSTNGTFVGRSRVREPTAVTPGTAIRVGRTVLELRP